MKRLFFVFDVRDGGAFLKNSLCVCVSHLCACHPHLSQAS